MLNVRQHVLMDTVVTSVWCIDASIKHDHCLWSGRSTVWSFDPASQLQVAASALEHVMRLVERGECDELTGDCLVP